jgi:hypothetical protein
MGEILFVNNASRLKSYLTKKRKSLSDGGYFIAFSPIAIDTKNLLERFGIMRYQKVSYSKSDKENLLQEYIKLFGRMGKWNGMHAHWWISDLASKNRFGSPLLSSLQDWMVCLQVIKAAEIEKKGVVFINLSWAVVIALRQASFLYNWKIQIIASPLSVRKFRLKSRFREWLVLIFSAMQAFKQINEVRKYFGDIKTKKKQKQPINLIKSFVYTSAFRKSGGYSDPFFGELAGILQKKSSGKIKVLTVAWGFSDRKISFQKMKELSHSWVVPLEYFLTYGDVVKYFFLLLVKLVKHSFKVKGRIIFSENDISPLVKEVLSFGGWRIQLNHYLHYAVGKRIASQYNIDSCFLTYEGRPWERALILGIRSVDNSVRIVGYQHTVVPQSAADMFQNFQELENIPLPDAILCTGTTPCNIIKRYSAFPHDRIRASCALRYGYLTDIKPFQRRQKIGKRTILVALCGVMEITSLVWYVIKQAKKNTNIEFVIRSHPVFTLDKILSPKEFKSHIKANIKLSEGNLLIDDVRNSDAILYWGSTVALESIRLGRPVIHFDRGDIFSYDPLFELEDFKWRVDNECNIAKKLKMITDLTDEEYWELQEKGMSYVMAYHHPITEEALSCFFEKNN